MGLSVSTSFDALGIASRRASTAAEMRIDRLHFLIQQQRRRRQRHFVCECNAMQRLLPSHIQGKDVHKKLRRRNFTLSLFLFFLCSRLELL